MENEPYDVEADILAGRAEDLALLWSLEAPVLKALLADWVARMRIGTLRGEGLASHAGYIKLIADEHQTTIEDVLSWSWYPV